MLHLAEEIFNFLDFVQARIGDKEVDVFIIVFYPDDFVLVNLTNLFIFLVHKVDDYQLVDDVQVYLALCYDLTEKDHSSSCEYAR